jgi:hypothetical protein
MQRAGLRELRVSLLKELLELNTLAPPSKITAVSERARLLFAYAEESLHVPSGQRAILELSAIEDKISDPSYSLKLSCLKVRSAIDTHNDALAVQELRKALTFAHRTADFHERADVFRVAGDYYRSKSEHERASRWYWGSLRRLLTPIDVCPYCLSRTFVRIGLEEISLGHCALAEDRLGKALMIARAIPSRQLQADALQYLAQHYLRHDRLREGIAAYLWTARLVKECDPTQEAANLEILLGDVIVEYGREDIAAILSEVQDNEVEVVLEALAPFKISDFAEKLPLDLSTGGDHW